jgi:hypothetical protein
VKLTADMALMDVSMMNAETKSASFTDIFMELSQKGLPTEVITRLKGICEKTKIIAGEVVQVGKIIVLKIIAFLRENSGLALGLAIGAAISALIGMIPFIGSYFQDLTQPLLLTLSALAGFKFETGNTYFESALMLAKSFFKLLADIFNAIKDYWQEKA